MMKLLQEVNRLSTVRLSVTQKMVLCRIAAAPSDEVAYNQVTDGVNVVAARDQLDELGMIQIRDHQASITDSGIKVMRDEALITDSNELTETGNRHAYAKDASELADDDTQVPNTEPQPNMNTSQPTQNVDRNQLPVNAPVEAGAGAGIQNDFASFNLLRSINATAVLLTN